MTSCTSRMGFEAIGDVAESAISLKPRFKIKGAKRHETGGPSVGLLVIDRKMGGQKDEGRSIQPAGFAFIILSYHFSVISIPLSNLRLGSGNQIAGRELKKSIHFLPLPFRVAMQLLSHQLGDSWRHLLGGSCVQKKCARSAGEDIFNGTSHFVTHGPDDFRADIGEIRVERFRQRGIG